jgi:hypothetical protein
MGSVLKINKLHFIALFKLQAVICAAVLLLHILISMAVIRLANTAGPAGVGDFIAIVWVLIMGLIFFSPSFKYTLSQGISRKTFFLAGSLSMAMIAAILAVLVVIFYVINLKIANVWMIYAIIYRDQGLLGLVVWEFAAFLFLGVLGWFIRLVYYVSNRNTKYIVSIAPFVLASLLTLFNALADGGIGRAILEFLKTVMGLSRTIPNPYTGMTSLLAAAVILGGAVFLLLRRAQIND